MSKKTISVSSRKAKGREFQKWIADQISDLTGIPNGKDELIESRPMGLCGCDVRLVGEAKQKFPFSVEAKRQESFSLHEWIKQAIANQQDGTDWLLFCKRNREKPIVVMDAEKFFELYKKVLNTPVYDSPKELREIFLSRDKK